MKLKHYPYCLILSVVINHSALCVLSNTCVDEMFELLEMVRSCKPHTCPGPYSSSIFMCMSLLWRLRDEIKMKFCSFSTSLSLSFPLIDVFRHRRGRAEGRSVPTKSCCGEKNWRIKEQNKLKKATIRLH